MRNKLLAPNGKMYTEAQLNRLNMKQVFDMLIDLGIADSQLYDDYKYENRSSTRRKRRSTRKTKSPKIQYVYGQPSGPERWVRNTTPGGPAWVKVRIPSKAQAPRYTVTTTRQQPRYTVTTTRQQPRYTVTTTKRKVSRSPRRTPRKKSTRPTFTPAIPDKGQGCTRHKSSLECAFNNCYWTGTKCLTF